MNRISDRSPLAPPAAGLHRPATPGRLALPLLVAVLLLPFANGADSIAAAAFLAPIFLLRFARDHRPRVGLPAVLALQTAAFAFQFRGMIPVPGSILFFIILIYGAAASAPYIADRLIAPRLRGWVSTLVFPCAWAATEYLVSLSPYGSWGAAGYALYGHLPVLQLLAVTGLAGLAFLIGWVAASANRIFELGAGSPLAVRPAAITAGVIGAVVLLGGARLTLLPPTAATVRIASLSKLDLRLHPDAAVAQRFFAHQALTPVEVDTIRARARVVDDDLLERAERDAGR
jgi:apolipoprotein N-acyltransferase